MDSLTGRRGRDEIEPREISQESNSQMRITWADGRVCNY